MNVAVTRAKRMCVVIGDGGTVSKSGFLKDLIHYFKSNPACIQRTAFDYQGNDEVRLGYGIGSMGVTKEELMEK